MGIDVITLALARKYAEKIAASGTTPSDTYSKEELDAMFNEIKEEIEFFQTDDEFILFGGDSRT